MSVDQSGRSTVPTGCVCQAHNQVDCPACSRIRSADIIAGQCTGCGEWARTGMHVKACPNLILGGVQAPRPAMLTGVPDDPGAKDARVKLERGWIKPALLRELAIGGPRGTTAALGRKYGVDRSTISNFKRRHRDEIAYVKRELLTEFGQLWISDKFNRLAELQHDVEMINERLSAADEGQPVMITDDGAEVYRAGADGSDYAALLAAKHRALRAAAEELGDLPTRMAVDLAGTMKINYAVEGVDLSAALQ